MSRCSQAALEAARALPRLSRDPHEAIDELAMIDAALHEMTLRLLALYEASRDEALSRAVQRIADVRERVCLELGQRVAQARRPGSGVADVELLSDNPVVARLQLADVRADLAQMRDGLARLFDLLRGETGDASGCLEACVELRVAERWWLAEFGERVALSVAERR